MDVVLPLRPGSARIDFLLKVSFDGDTRGENIDLHDQNTRQTGQSSKYQNRNRAGCMIAHLQQLVLAVNLSECSLGEREVCSKSNTVNAV